MKILEPLTLGSITLKNRLMFPPLTTGYEGRDGSITDQSIAFYERLAQGGVGYIVLGDVNPVKSFSPTPRLHDDDQINGFRRLTDAVHTHGAKIAAQIFYPEYDVAALGALAAGGDMVAVRQKLHYDMEHFTDQVTAEQLNDILSKMVACAVRAEKAGFDAIQIHGDRLLGTLCSTKMNHRQDNFGGSLENRVRFARMLVQALRKAVPNVILDYKLAVVTPERGRGGIDAQDAPQFAQWLAQDGISMLHVAQANHTGNLADTIPPMGIQPYGFFVEVAEQVKSAVTIPVSTVGRIVDPLMAERILANGKIDLVAVGRPLVCDPDWILKLVAGKPETIRRCMCCNKGCTDAIQKRAAISCVLNAESGNEFGGSFLPADVVKRITVVGGGLAGLEAARVAALRGHQVTVLEKQETMGGQILLASMPPRKAEMLRSVVDLKAAAVEAGAQILTGQAATVDTILAQKPDVVFIATGAGSVTPSLPGVHNANVLDAWKILARKESAYGKVVVIGGGLVGCETAEYIAQQGCKVTIVEMQDKIAAGESDTVLPTMLKHFEQAGVSFYTKTKVAEITPNQVRCIADNGEPLIIPCNCVVLAVGARPVAFDTALLEAAGIEVTRIGDCAERTADISNAIRTAYRAACAV